MTYDPTKPVDTQADMATAFGSIRENLRAISRMELPQTSKATSSTVAIGATDYIVKFTGSTDVDTINITAETTLPDVIALWGYASDGFRFVSGGNLVDQGLPILVRPYILFRIIYFKDLDEVSIQSYVSGFEEYASTWLRRGFIQKAYNNTILDEGYATITQSGTRTDQQYSGWEMLRYATSATLNNVAGFYASNFAEIDLAHIFKFGATVYLETQVTNKRVWVGLTDYAIDATDSPSGTQSVCAFRYSTNASDTTWQFCELYNGGSLVVTDTGVTVAADTVYQLEVAHTGTDIAAYINGELVVQKTAEVWVAGTDLAGPYARITTLTTAARYLSFSTFWTETQ